ncbi:5'-3' exonuclease [Xanthomonas phaseoli]|uniref:Exodeoxyribonuclease IX n=2 Tax=Xanthomonas TaxID=338 RepID=A0A8I2BSK1_XANMN|nr:5'-3' exonuclease H3TH domain-containing protein [Xanthomonas phaseoli]KUF24957.1 exodeoxyribonuclease IX [Xanthomonas phaseoli pv. manihotis]MBO9720844.1 exodeoxyribonuclease IX [Xanthomonas phaseoli pv. manihotis]MBO9755862.1 exodeoxyribonuclease IX [Xanthomonas phaseoli pv. manihotis]MBO9758264.1 exodeoxyribonuclease IX [Xanthomonas phaseoli pv. manihotis]MBO9764268.1 exodeoxyribonuclease IX [Xanthomonas phaseoli pv. manihotis]
MTTPTNPLDAAPLAIQRPSPLYLVDASLYVFRAWHSIPDEFQDAQGWPTNAVHGFARFLLDLLEREDPQHITIAFDEALDSCFRHAIYPAYKGNRTPTPDALQRQFAHCKALCAALGLSVLAHRDYEADDLIGSALHSVRAHGLRGVIVSADKDLSQLLLEHDEQWDYARNQRWGMDGVKARHGVHAHQIADYLALCGDAIDNIPGVNGIGAKSAAVLLAHFGSLDALLERIDEIPFLRLRGAAQMAVRLREQREHALLWRQLTTIALDAPLALTEAGFTRAHADADMLAGLCESLRFGPLTRRRLLAASSGAPAPFPPVSLAQGPRP